MKDVLKLKLMANEGIPSGVNSMNVSCYFYQRVFDVPCILYIL